MEVHNRPTTVTVASKKNSSIEVSLSKSSAWTSDIEAKSTVEDSVSKCVDTEQPPQLKRFQFAARPQKHVSTSSDVQTSKEIESNLYLLEVTSLSEITDALAYWLSKENRYTCISTLALDLASVPASQAYVDRAFSDCGSLSARKRNRATAGTERRAFLKLNCRQSDL